MDVFGNIAQQGRRRLDWLIPSWLEDSTAYDQSENLDLDTIGLTFLLNAIAALIFITIIGKLRKNPDHPYRYSPRRLHLPKQTPPDLPKTGIFSWILPCFSISYEDILYYAGLDALMYIRFHYLGLKVCAIFAVYGLCVLIPINATGGRDESSLFNTLSLSNIVDGSRKMWAHVVGMYLLTGIVMWQLVIEFRTYTRLRHEFLRRRRALFRSVMVEEVPRQLRSQANLRAYFEKLYPDQVVEVFICQRLEVLTALIEKRENVLANLEHAMFKLQKQGKRTKVWTGLFRRQDAIDYWQAVLHELNDEVSREQARRLRFARQANRQNLGRAAEKMENMLKRLHFDPGAGDVYTELAEDDTASQYLTTMESGEPAGMQQYGTTEMKDGDERSSSTTDGGDRLEERLSDVILKGLKKNPVKVVKAGVEKGLTAMGLMGDIYGHEKSSEMMALLEKHAPVQQKMASKAFITFKTFTPATIARQVLHSANPGYMKISEAPEPMDIHWGNINLNSRKKQFRHWLGIALYLFLLITYIVPVTLIGEYTSSDALTHSSTTINYLVTKYSIFSSAVELVQPSCLLMLMVTIPPVLRLIGFLEGHITESGINNQMLGRYYTFLLVNVLLVVSIAGSVLASIEKVVDTPTLFFEKLGLGLPKVAGFFTDYVIIKCFTGNSFELSRFTAYIQHLLRKVIWFDLTPRDRRQVVIGLRDFLDPGWFPYGKYIAQDMLVMSILMVYAVMAPLILIPGMLFYISSLLVYRHQLLYIYVPVYETGGQMLPKVFRRWVFGLFIGQATLVGVFLTKSGYNMCYSMIILFFVTYYFKTKMRGMWEPITLSMPLELTEFLDRQPLDPLEDRVQEAERYIQPALAAPALASPEIE
mmetsp:Transcript_28583/g.37431  ORF Transcript_28583/g.37431 Transcript_28583/m.37431 type:complete len:872 (-) Transcript_28583:241-2856(-)|eukprot:CAMPEP_0117751004 /NCGR_PEP_ID=MMETSP0947-20121206/10710_1 /TAXON_ID=44440 /ORGANISM="Chattonella subsalsa, Strain CCMP2191" /LENGTH=871 /DNA_ID=CAMNT_0005569289 /DNA_START=142 /DNA_END=2757 /DNA_ORIENTATION=-